MNVNRREIMQAGVVAVAGASCTLPLLSQAYPTESMKYKTYLCIPIHKEWVRDNDWRSIYDQLAFLTDDKFYRPCSETYERIKLIDEALREEMKQKEPRGMNILLCEDGEISWGFYEGRTYPTVPINGLRPIK